MENNYYRNSRNIALIISLILFVILFVCYYLIIDSLLYKKVKIDNPKETIGVIKRVENIHKRIGKRIGRTNPAICMNYSADFTIEYEVNNKKYSVTTRLERSLSMDINKHGKSSNGWLPGDNVKIIYDEKDPTNMKVDNSYSDKKTAIVLGIIAFLIFLNIYVDKRKKRKAKVKIEKEKSK